MIDHRTEEGGGHIQVATVTWNGISLSFRTNQPAAVEQLASRSDLLGMGAFSTEHAPPGAHHLRAPIDLAYYESAGQTGVSVTAKEVIFRAPWPSVQGSRQLESLLLQIFDYANLCRDRYFVHGSAVSLGDYALTFAGPKESGKTTIATEMCRRFGGKLIANGYAEVRVEGGEVFVTPNSIPFFAFRSQALYLAHRELYGQIYGSKADVSELDSRKRISAASVGIETEQRTLPLARMYFVGLGQAAAVEEYRSDPIRSRVELYDEITSRIRGSSLMLIDNHDRFGAYLPSLVNSAIDSRIMTLVDLLQIRDLLWDIRGPLQPMVEHISQSVNHWVGGG